jgi:transcriptional regulator with XRE-family HTH domain
VLLLKERQARPSSRFHFGTEVGINHGCSFITETLTFAAGFIADENVNFVRRSDKIKERPTVILGHRLRKLREQRRYSQGYIQNWTGLLRCYITRVENGYTVPSIETLEKMARALDIPHRLFYERRGSQPSFLKVKRRDITEWGTIGQDARYWSKLRPLLRRMDEPHRRLLVFVAQEMAKRKKNPAVKWEAWFRS